jgi:hypothetical protein
MIEVNNPVQIAADIFSLISSLELNSAASAESINSSTPLAQDFSALLTEMMGPVAAAETTPAMTPMTAPQLPQLSRLPELTVTDRLANDAQLAAEAQKTQLPENGLLPLPEVSAGQPAVNEPIKAEEKPEASEETLVAQQTGAVAVPFVCSLPFVPAVMTSTAAVENKPLVPQLDAQKHLTAAVPVVVQPKLEKAWADVRKFEFTVKHEAVKAVDSPSQLTAAAPTAPEPAPAISPADAAKQAMVTTDPILNVQQQEMPPRVVPILRATLDTRMPDRSKPAAASTTASSETTVAPAGQATDFGRPGFDAVEQVRPAHHVEIPDVPHVQVVRTVAMEVGDADSQVVIRIQERSGDLSLVLNAATEPMQRDLSSSVDKLVNALKKEEVQVSSVEVTRKSPIEKVRRMKEAR